MNVPPECDGYHIGHARARWTVIDKTTGKVLYRCTDCLGYLQVDHRYSIYPARDYSKHANGHDLTADHSRSDHGGINGV